LRRETCFLDDGTHELLRPLRVYEVRLPLTQDLRHFRRVDMLVDVFRVVRLEQLGELVAGVLDEVVERPHACQYYEVTGIELPPQLVTGDGRVNDYVHVK